MSLKQASNKKNSEESQEEEESEEVSNEEEESEDEIIDLDEETKQSEPPKSEENAQYQLNTELQNQELTTVPHYDNLKSTALKNITSTQKSAMSRKFDPNSNLGRIDNNGKSIISKMSEDFANKFANKKNVGKVSMYEFLLHDEHISKFEKKNTQENFEKFQSFINRNKEFRTKMDNKHQQMAEKDKIENQTICHGKPNGKDLKETDIRPAEEFLNYNLEFQEKKKKKVEELKAKIVEENNKILSFNPKISEKTKKLAEKKIQDKGETHSRLYKEPIKNTKEHQINQEIVKRKLKMREINPDENKGPKNVKKPKTEIEKEVRKLYEDAVERKKNKEKPLPKLNEIYDLDNIASESSKLLILEKFLKHYELCLLTIFGAKSNVNITFDNYCRILHDLGFVNYDQNDYKSALERRHKGEDDKSSVKESITRSGDSKELLPTKSLRRGKSMKDEEWVIKKVEKEYKVIKESWIILAKNQEKLNTNWVLVFLTGILGLYDGENKGKKTRSVKNTIEKENQQLIDPNASIEQNFNDNFNNTNILSDVGNSEGKPPKHTKNVKKVTKKNSSNDNLPFNCGIAKKKSDHGKSEEIKKEERNVLLESVVPEIDLSFYSFQFKNIQKYKVQFRVFYENRMNFLLNDHGKIQTTPLTPNIIANYDLTFHPKLNMKSIKSAEKYRKRCYDELEENDYQINEKKRMNLEQVYKQLRELKDNKIARLKQESEDKTYKECTFTPNSGLKSESDSQKTKPSQITQKLFEDAKNRNIQKKKREEEKKETESELPDECIYYPTIHAVDHSVFEVPNITDEKYVKKKIERYEKSRLEKKLQLLREKRGYYDLKKNLNSEEIDQLIKEEGFTFKFGIEQKTYKDTFETRKSQLNKSKRQSNVKISRNKVSSENEVDEENKENDENASNENEGHEEENPGSDNNNLLLQLEINISESQKELLEVYQNENPGEVAQDFCNKHNLDEEKKNFIESLIIEKINELNN